MSGCTHDGHTACAATTRRTFFKTGVAVVGAGGLATIMDPRELFAQVRVFPPPPPAVSPIAGLMDTHVHTAPDVFGRALDDVKVEETTAAVKEVGAQNFILATDLGQTGNPSPADGLQLFVTDLMGAGLSKDQIMTMGREVTGKLLMG